MKSSTPFNSVLISRGNLPLTTSFANFLHFHFIVQYSICVRKATVMSTTAKFAYLFPSSPRYGTTVGKSRGRLFHFFAVKRVGKSLKFRSNNLNSFSAILIMDRRSNAQKKGDIGSCVKLIVGPSPYCDMPLYTLPRIVL